MFGLGWDRTIEHDDLVTDPDSDRREAVFVDDEGDVARVVYAGRFFWVAVAAYTCGCGSVSDAMARARARTWHAISCSLGTSTR